MIHKFRLSHLWLKTRPAPSPSLSSLPAIAYAPPSAPTTTTPAQAANEYIQLKQLIRQQKLLEKQPVYYTFKILVLLGMFALGIAVLALVHSFWLQLLNAAYMALVTTQFGLLGHDAGHRQIFNKTWKNDVICLIAGNLLVGMSCQWWIDKHNQHHSHPNQDDMDPDIDIPVIALGPDDLEGKGPVARFIIKYQAIFFFPLLLLVGIDLQIAAVRFLLQHKEKYHTLEVALILTHIVSYLAVIFFFLGFWPGLLFILVHQTLAGLYLGSIFAPNHKGMPILAKDTDMGFLYRQVVTARNVKAHPITDFLYGGLNYQIEHHLFPSVPRNRLKEVQRIVKTFCHEHAIPYYETSVLQSYKEILQHLHHVSAPLRTRQSVVR